MAVIVDDLAVDVGVGAVDGEARALGGPAHAPTDAGVASDAGGGAGTSMATSAHGAGSLGDGAFAGFAANPFALVANAFAFVGFGGAHVSDFGGLLADALFVVPANGDEVAFDGEG